MTSTPGARRNLPLLPIIILGAAMAFLAFLIAEFTVGTSGHRINTNQLPAEAQTIARENYPTTIPPEQWGRIHSVLNAHGQWPSFQDIAVLTIRKATAVFVCLPLFALLALQVGRFQLTLPKSLVLLGPSLAVLAWAWLTTPLKLLAP